MTTYLFVSPKPSVWLVRKLFSLTTYTEHENILEIKENVTLLSDITYVSSNGMNELDIFIKTDLMDEVNVPIILWIHGGAFVAGDKDDVASYMYVLANEGYAVISINYGLGYEYQYSTPLIQIGEAYTHVKNEIAKYPYLDLDNMIVGGDSAGAFVAGDKDDVASYMYVLANEGYAVISINYGLGYEYQYPTPLIQIGEAYTHVKNEIAKYPYLDLDNMIVGGDSAGAFLAAQFVINNTNPAYSELSKVSPVLTKDQIKGAILYCGPYDFSLLLNLLGDPVTRLNRSAGGSALTKIVGFFAQKIGYAFLGEKNWAQDPKWDILTLTNYVTSDFPPTFITDAKNISFEEHGKRLASKLENLGVSVETVFYDAELAHEYQFNLGTVEEETGRNYAMETLDKVLAYLQNLPA
ncbi:alpha/beta hydrolase [Acholeplasma hippikon]|uniref:Acetyl esterase n=1 Tax=Acholeplasma hippikon TaxID=264636 RepID=A0A449BK16_9MOLU|nr:alpha/beta hydrolase fold domain-containing protein [Acholeplasma hippikon]VEU82794.1 acetyl esterase [Acholeplasma hippikon]